jgi:RimJ/RimL family protein N-acetyltransferase
VEPVLHGRHVIVRPAVPVDYDFLYATAILTPAGGKWRLLGELPPFDQFLGIVFQGAKATSVVCSVEDQRLLGMVQIWNHDPLSRNAHVTTFFHPKDHGKGWPMEGLLLFVDFAFRAYDLKKIYVEVNDGGYDVYKALVDTGILIEEGCLKGHRYVMGEWQDCHILALYRDTFYGRFQAVLDSLAAGAGAD